MNPINEEISGDEDNIKDLDDFIAIENKVIRFALNLLPWGILPVSILALQIGDGMLASGLLAASLSLFAFQRLMQHIPYTLTVLWRRNIIAERSNIFSKETVNGEELSEIKSSTSPQLEAKYYKYISNFQSLLNHPSQWVFGLSFVFLVHFGWAAFEKSLGYSTASWNLLYLFQYLIGFVIGLMAWRMIITGVEIRRLGTNFDINPNLGHPDKCAGLEPLGNLCLWNALILSILGIFLGGWIILIPKTHYDQLFYTLLFYRLLLIPIIWGFVSFFIPLWSIHKILLNKQKIIQKQIDNLSKNIDQLSHKMLEEANQMETDEYEKISKKLEILQSTYQQYKDYPVWPFNSQIIKKFALSQAIPVLTYLGASESQLGLANYIVDTLGGYV